MGKINRYKLIGEYMTSTKEMKILSKSDAKND